MSAAGLAEAIACGFVGIGGRRCGDRGGKPHCGCPKAERIPLWPVSCGGYADRSIFRR